MKDTVNHPQNVVTKLWAMYHKGLIISNSVMYVHIAFCDEFLAPEM